MTETDSGWQLAIRAGMGNVIPHDHFLTLEARAYEVETLGIVKDVLERHLLKFAAKLEPLEVNWVSQAS